MFFFLNDDSGGEVRVHMSRGGITDLLLLLAEKSNSLGILPVKHFNLLLPEQEDWKQLYELLEGMSLLVKKRKAIISSIRAGCVG